VEKIHRTWSYGSDATVLDDDDDDDDDIIPSILNDTERPVPSVGIKRVLRYPLGQFE